MTRTDRLEQIAELADRMRVLQRRYFRTREHRAMVDAKRLEAALDERLAELGVEGRAAQSTFDELSPGLSPDGG